MAEANNDNQPLLSTLANFVNANSEQATTTGKAALNFNGTFSFSENNAKNRSLDRFVARKRKPRFIQRLWP